MNQQIDMKKHFRYIQHIFSLSIQKNLAYPKDLFWFLLFTPVFLFTEALGLYLIFTVNGSQSIMGFTFLDGYFISSIIALIWMLSAVLTQVSTGKITHDILHGGLDYILLKPISPFVALWFQQSEPKKIPLLLLRVLILLCIFYYGNYSFSPLQYGALLSILLTSILLFHCFFLCSEHLAFFLPSFNGNMLTFQLVDTFTFFPPTIYPKPLIGFFSIILPFFLVGVPVYAIINNTYTWGDFFLSWSLTILWSTLTYLLWKEGVKRYISAN